MKTTITIQTRKIEDAIEHANAYDVQIRRGYSGRAMYGDTCFGLVGTPSQITQVLVGLAGVTAESGEDFDVVYDLVKAMRTDNMGRDMIYYFPGFELDGDHSGYEDD